MRRLLGRALLLVVVVAPGCGKRGDPRPPLRKTPQPLGQFRVAQRGARLEVTGIAPRSSTEGVALETMTVELLRADAEGDFLKLAKKRAFTVQAGETFTEPETLPAPGTTVRIAARAVASRKPSAMTGIVVLPVQAPPTPPANLEAAVVSGGVALNWTGKRPTPLPSPRPTPPPSPPPLAQGSAATAPTAIPTPAVPALSAPASGAPAAAALHTDTVAASGTAAPLEPETSMTRSGFWLYRRSKAGVYASPLFPEPIAEKAYLDKEAAPDQEWCYVARAVVSTEPLIESESSREACLTARDVSPPSVPSGLTLLAQPGGLELRWTPSPEGDLVLYRVYRAAPSGAEETLAEIPAGTSVYLDEAVAPGTSYRYSVTAVDRAGNESAHSAPLLGNTP